MANGNTFVLSPRFLLAALCAGALLGALPGCDKDRGDDPAQAALDEQRPEALTQAAGAIKAGQSATAQKQLEEFLAQEKKSPYRAEAFYLLGQAWSLKASWPKARISSTRPLWPPMTTRTVRSRPSPCMAAPTAT